jgi:predicted alpha/beta superfamily hydrolase
MRKIVCCALTSIFIFSAQAQDDSKIIIGKVDSVYSTALKEQRKVWVYTPDMTSFDHSKGHRYPVVYLLDGDGHFPSVVGLIQQLSQVNGNNVLPEMIVVGIPNTNRTRDLTPTHVISDPPMMDSNFSQSSGGGEQFVSFIENELIPHIDSTYPTAPYKILIGHSFGGLTVMNVITNHTKLFNAYIAIDPSMWYDHERFLATTEKKLRDNHYEKIRLFVGIANTMPDGMTLEKMKGDKSSDTRHIRSIFELDRFLKTNTQNGLKYSSKYYGEDNHGSVPLASEYDGLRFIFDYHRINLNGKDFTDSTDAIVSKMRNHYGIISKELGYKVSPNELLVNSLGYGAMNNKNYARAEALFQMNIDNYPNSSNVYDSYGDLMIAEKDTVKARSYFEKALVVKENAFTRQKLNALKGIATVKLTVEDLKKYEGQFDMENANITVTIKVKGNDLWAEVPGEGEFQLVPVSQNSFTVKDLKGYEVKFDFEGEKAVGFTSIQPNGSFKAKLKR